jgi:hypothetical protein
MNYAKNHTFDQFHHALSNATLSREHGSKVEYSTFGIGLLGIFKIKIKHVTFDKLLDHNIIDLRGMNDTTAINGMGVLRDRGGDRRKHHKSDKQR